MVTALKELVTFKIVPMINVDGVLVGNYRTSFIGKDLNRLYSQNPRKNDQEEDKKSHNVDPVLIPEITAIKQLIIQFQKRILTF
ncbi:MAG: M14 family zinc carboxypeptidase, partial [Flammeovirgaceae bacterium]